MSPARALEINNLVVRAWLIRERLSDAALPDLSGVSLPDAREASEMMRRARLGETRNADGSTTYTCYVEPTRVWSVVLWALGQERANAN